jgi:aldose 1-epimerase
VPSSHVGTGRSQGVNLELRAGGCRLWLQSHLGGSISGFEWQHEPLMRPAIGPLVTDSACFPMLPFCNRIAFGAFRHRDKTIELKPNFPGHDHPHPLHGYGWLAEWEVVEYSAQSAVMRHRHAGGDWPWPYVAEQRFVVTAAGLEHSIALTNTGDCEMPAGLGFHPYFPRTSETLYHGCHSGEWQTDADGLPRALVRDDTPIDWWQGAPIGTRPVDTVYSGREGALEIIWPDRDISLRMFPSANLTHTAVFAPRDEDWFCVEPMSHATDAVNARPGQAPMAEIAPGQRIEASVRYEIVQP